MSESGSDDDSAKESESEEDEGTRHKTAHSRSSPSRSHEEEGDSDGSENSEEFEVEGDEPDDETTLIEEERLCALQGGDAGGGAAAEIALLQGESEIPIDELRAMYAGIDDMSESGSDDDSVEDLVSHGNDEHAESVVETASDSDTVPRNHSSKAGPEQTRILARRKRRRTEITATEQGSGNEVHSPLPHKSISEDRESQDNKDDEGGVEGAMQRLAAADRRARSVFVSTRRLHSPL